MKRLILVNQVTGPMFIDIANSFQQKDYEVILVTGIIEQTGESLHSAIDVVKFVEYRRNNPLSRILTWVFFFIQCLLYLKRQSNRTSVLLVSNSPLIPLLAYYLREKINVEFNILIYDIYPDVLERSGVIKKSSHIASWWRRMNKKAYMRAARLYTISDGMKGVLSRYAPYRRWQVVYPWVDTDFIKPLSKDKNPFAIEHGLSDRTVVLYSGNMGKTHDLLPLLKAARALQNISKYFFLMIGDGSQKQDLIKYSEKYNLTNVLFLPFQKPEILPWSLTAADIGVVSLSGAAAQLSVPSKTFYQMAAGNALLCLADIDSELARIVVSNNCGIVCSQSEEKDIADKLIALDRATINEWKLNSRKASEKYTKNNVELIEL